MRHAVTVEDQSYNVHVPAVCHVNYGSHDKELRQLWLLQSIPNSDDLDWQLHCSLCEIVVDSVTPFRHPSLLGSYILRQQLVRLDITSNFTVLSYQRLYMYDS